MQPQELNLESEVFEDFLALLDQKIHNTVAIMMEKGLTSGTVTGKIGIRLEEKISQETGETCHLIVIEPTVGSKIGTSGSAKTPPKAGVIIRDRAGELIIADNQISMDEMLEKGA